MLVIVLENASDLLRGMLTRWVIEVKPGVYTGRLSAKVRDKLWEMIEEHHPRGALMICSVNNEQGYCIKMLGEPKRKVVDLDGLQLIRCE